jgi:hypothetical protein
MSEIDPPTEEWERVLLAAARLQNLLGDGVLVGGTASAMIAGHRFSHDADHVLTGLRENYDEILATLESVAGWKTARVQRPVQILGSLDGIETGIRQLIRREPLETMEIRIGDSVLRIPTAAEILRIKALLILKRNATRDYLDFAAISEHLGMPKTLQALNSFDALYPQDNGESPLMQLEIQLASPMPFDLESDDLSEYRHVEGNWRSWEKVREVCTAIAFALFEAQRRQT